MMTDDQRDQAIINLCKCIKLITGNYGIRQETIDQLLKVIVDQ